MRHARTWLMFAGLLVAFASWPAPVVAAEQPAVKAPAATRAGTDAQSKALDEIWAKVYDRPQCLAKLDRPVVVYLDIQHPEVIRGQLRTLDKPLEKARAQVMRNRFRDLSGLQCLVVHQSEVTGADLERPQIKALLIGGRSRVLSRAKDEEFFSLIRNTRIPTIGFCGGCQLIGQAYSAKVTPLRKLKAGETDPNPKYHPGFFKEWDFLKVQVIRPDPLLANLPKEIVVKEAHAFQMQRPPEGFQLLASTAECRVQAIRHGDRLLYGVQFHPEAFDDAHPDGRIVLENFFRLALRP